MEMTAECVKTYDLKIDSAGNVIGESSQNVRPAGDVVHERATDYAAKHGVDYQTALNTVLDRDRELKRAYAEDAMVRG